VWDAGALGWGSHRGREIAAEGANVTDSGWLRGLGREPHTSQGGTGRASLHSPIRRDLAWVSAMLYSA
jgi:hypothetical protein